MGFCKLVAVGNLGKDVELRTTPQGISVAEFSMAVTTHKETQWFKVTVWRQLAENCAKYLKKGDPALVDGTLSVETYETKEGKIATTLVINANDVQFLKSKSQEEEKRGEVLERNLNEVEKAPSKPKKAMPDDDIPF